MFSSTPVPEAHLALARAEVIASEQKTPADVVAEFEEMERWDFKQWVIDVTFGVFAIVLGIAGLAVPILPGWLPIAAGVVVLAGRFPPLRRLLSRVIMTDRAQSFFDRCARSEKSRRLLTKALLRKKVRAAMEPVARQSLVALLARKSTKTSAESESDQVEN